MVRIITLGHATRITAYINKPTSDFAFEYCLAATGRCESASSKQQQWKRARGWGQYARFAEAGLGAALPHKENQETVVILSGNCGSTSDFISHRTKEH